MFVDKKKSEDQELSSANEGPAGFLEAIVEVFKFSLKDTKDMAEKATLQAMDTTEEHHKDGAKNQEKPLRLGRVVASSLPPTITLVRRLMSRLLVDSQMDTALTKMQKGDFLQLMCLPVDVVDGNELEFDANQFTRAFRLEVAKIAMEALGNKHTSQAPAHVLHPLLSMISDVLRCLEEGSKVVMPKPASTATTSSRDTLTLPMGASLRDILPQGRGGQILQAMGILPVALGGGGPDEEEDEEEDPPFEPSEESINQLSEMGFSEYSTDSTKSLALLFANTASCSTCQPVIMPKKLSTLSVPIKWRWRWSTCWHTHPVVLVRWNGGGPQGSSVDKSMKREELLK